MKASLQLKMGQQLTMTPQLQQAIRLLQLSTLDLQQEIQSALDSNPLLDVDEEFENKDAQQQNEQSAEPELQNTDPVTEHAGADNSKEVLTPLTTIVRMRTGVKTFQKIYPQTATGTIPGKPAPLQARLPAANLPAQAKTLISIRAMAIPTIYKTTFYGS